LTGGVSRSTLRIVELRHVQAFVAVSEELHFGRAADRLRLSPSPVSRTIAELEREIGVPLFVRGHHTVALTAAGTSLLPEARSLLESWSTFLAHGRGHARDAARPQIRLGAPTLAPTMVVDVLLEQLAVVRPGTPVDVRFASSTDLLAALSAGDLDLSIALLPVGASGVQAVPFARYELSCALRDDDELARRTRLTGEDLAGRRILMSTLSVQRAAIKTVSQWLADLGAVVELLPDVDLIHISQLVRRGRGLTLTSASGALAHIYSQPGLTTIPVDSPGPGIEIGVAARTGGDIHLWADLTKRLAMVTEGGLLRT
jgi:DNA-binding transcriptional LysR family regulator